MRWRKEIRHTLIWCSVREWMTSSQQWLTLKHCCYRFIPRMHTCNLAHHQHVPFQQHQQLFPLVKNVFRMMRAPPQPLIPCWPQQETMSLMHCQVSCSLACPSKMLISVHSQMKEERVHQWVSLLNGCYLLSSGTAWLTTNTASYWG